MIHEGLVSYLYSVVNNTFKNSYFFVMNAVIVSFFLP